MYYTKFNNLIKIKLFQRLPVGLVPNVMPLDLLKADGACERLQYGGGNGGDNGGGGGGPNNILIPIFIGAYCYFNTKK